MMVSDLPVFSSTYEFFHPIFSPFPFGGGRCPAAVLGKVNPHLLFHYTYYFITTNILLNILISSSSTAYFLDLITVLHSTAWMTNTVIIPELYGHCRSYCVPLLLATR